MAHRLVISDRAVREIGEAYDWYEEQLPGLGAEFLAALAIKGLGPLSPLIQLLPSGVSWKTRIIMPWMLNAGASLERFVVGARADQSVLV